jgi:hypothetical protein
MAELVDAKAGLGLLNASQPTLHKAALLCCRFESCSDHNLTKQVFDTMKKHYMRTAQARDPKEGADTVETPPTDGRELQDPSNQVLAGPTDDEEEEG